jgi:hypothetical protein
MRRYRKRIVLLAVFLAAFLVTIMVTGQNQPQLPAPSEDRVGFPEGYQETYKLLFTFDRRITRAYGSSTATTRLLLSDLAKPIPNPRPE